MATLTARSNAVTPGRMMGGEPASKAEDEVLAPLEQQTGGATVTISESKTLDTPKPGDPVGPINSQEAGQGEAQGGTGPVQVTNKTGAQSDGGDRCSTQSKTSAPPMQSTNGTATRAQVSQMTVEEARAQGFLPRESKEALGDLIWWTLALVLVAVGVKIFDFLG